jgi:hypothetical protein
LLLLRLGPLPLAIIAIGFAIAAADRLVISGADLRELDANAIGIWGPTQTCIQVTPLGNGARLGSDASA